MPPVVLTVVATAVAVALLISTLLFILEVFFRRRDMPGQTLGLVLSLLCDVVFVVVFADRLPGRPTGMRDLFSVLPGITTVAFVSSVIGLVSLAVVYLLRALIYYRLFIVPAMTLSDADYNSPDQLEERANDYTAPVLAFTALAVCLASGFAGTYALPTWAGVFICIGLIGLYFASSYLRALRRLLVELGIRARIVLRIGLIHLSRVIILIIFYIGRAERWRTRQQEDDVTFESRWERRFEKLLQLAETANERDRRYLRRLVSEGKLE